MQARTAIVTGAASGIGHAVVHRLVADGLAVVGADIQDPGPDDATDGVTWMRCDVSVEDEVAALVATTVDRHGAVDVLVNVAGTTITGGHPVEDFPVETWRRILDTNLMGSFLCTKHVVAGMKARGSGAIVNIASSSAAQPSQPGQVAYVASKGGVVAMTRELCLELAPHGITVNAVSPGPTRTPLVAGHGEQWYREKTAVVPAGRLAEPEDIAGVVAFLASDEARYVNGHAIAVDGGMTAVVMPGRT